MAGRRGKGEGSIFKRSDGRWVATLDLGYQNGKRSRRHFYGKTRREVEEQLAAALRDNQLGVLLEPNKQTVGQFLVHWLEYSVKPSVRPRTFEFYTDKVRLYLLPELGRVLLSRLTPQDLQSLYTRIINR